jgi:hypothetical protein
MSHLILNKENIDNCILLLERLLARWAPPYVTFHTRRKMPKILTFFNYMHKKGYIVKEDIILQYIEIKNNYNWKQIPSLELRNTIKQFLSNFITICKEFNETL